MYRVAMVALVVVVLLSADAVVERAYITRQYNYQIQKLEQDQRLLREEYGRLLIERSTIMTPANVEANAKALNMVKPSAEDIRVIYP